TYTPCYVRLLGLAIATLDQGRAGRIVGERGDAEIGQMLLLPRPARQSALGRRRVGRIVQPAVPVGRNARGFGLAVVHHPAFATPALDDALVVEVAIAVCVGADQFAAHLGEEPGAE